MKDTESLRVAALEAEISGIREQVRQAKSDLAKVKQEKAAVTDQRDAAMYDACDCNIREKRMRRMLEEHLRTWEIPKEVNDFPLLLFPELLTP